MRVTVSGTHDGDVMGRPATGRRFEVTSVGIFRRSGSRLAEHRACSTRSECWPGSERRADGPVGVRRRRQLSTV